MPACRRVLALILLLLCLPLAALAQPAAVQGRVAWPADAAGPVALRGEWGFAWERYVDPTWQQLPTRAFARVPMPWNDVTADGKPPGENGWGSYVLQVDCPAGRRLAVEALGERTASRLFINGHLVAQHGQLGNSADTTAAAVHNRVPLTEEFPCPLRLTLHVANFEHRAGGFVRPLAAGPADALAKDRESRILRHSFLLAAYLLTALVALIFFAVRRRERTPLVYGLFCLAMAVYTDLIGERLLLRGFPAQISWLQYMRVEYLAWIASMALFAMTLHGLFPTDIRRSALRMVVAVLGVAALAVLVLPPAVYSYSAVPGQAIAVAVGVFVAVRLVLAQRENAFDARVLLVGMAAVVAALAIDLLLIDAPRADRKFSPEGFALFLLSPAVVIARRLSHALNAEERSRTLEENARLREDVERMSRHDLKTPLNSILGATRLLAEGGRLDAGQRELAGVVQRAAMRMVEMVNLSLGLYRMETGSYALRPKAVDLQDVVTRVLVDLHGLAEDSGVVVHVHGSDRAPLQVWGEELLCYSIVANLVKNAVEATGAGGMVALELGRGDPVRLTVHNPGPVPAEIAGRFFEKYVTGGKSGGTGLGTYSARLMARAQHGELSMETGAAGTTLTLTLPAARERAVPAPAAAVAEVAPAWPTDGGRTVLVVDDDEFNRLVTRRYLPSPPFEVDTAENGRQAEDAMARRWPQFLVLDMEMPVRSGIETVRWVRAQEAAARGPRCGIVMLSGNDDAESERKALEAGADRFLAKPVAREALLAALRELDAPASGAAAPAAPPQPAQEDAVVRIDPEWIGYFPEFRRIQQENVAAMARALATGDRAQLAFVAHRAFGGLATMGLAWAATQTRFLEENARTLDESELTARVAVLQDYMVRVECAPAE
jgi:signal transduction histidine kinase/CheY-like chemotaxis protein